MFSNKTIAQYKFKYPALKENVETIKQEFIDICKKHDFAYKDLNSILVVIDEATSNIIRHAYKDTMGDIEFIVAVKERGLDMTIIDKGKSFDWKHFKTPDLNEYARVGKKGGLGLWIIRKLTNQSDYVITEKGNELHLTKNHSKTRVIEKVFSVLSIKGVKEKFVLSTTVFIVALMSSIYFYFIFHERESVKDKFITYSMDLVRGISESSKNIMIKGNYLNLIKLLNEIKTNNGNIHEIFITDAGGLIMAHNESKYLYKPFSYTEDGGKVLVQNEYPQKVRVVKFGKKLNSKYDITQPIIFNSEKLGDVHLILTPADFEQVMASKRLNIVGVSLGMLVLILTALGIYMLLNLIIKPLETLREGVLAIGEGRLSHRIEIDGTDEFSQIANAFNDMAVKFKGAQEAMVEQEKMQKEIQVAKDIQQTLLPKNIPDTEGFDIASLYRSAKDVGGDYFDINKVGPHLIGVIVADVSGKGVPGSLVMTIIRTAVRLVSFRNRSSKAVLCKVNNFVKEDMKKGMFVTAFYSILDSVSRKIIFSSAGHNPMILYRAKEDKVYYIKPKGFPLGINLPDDDLFRKIMGEEKIKLEKGDLMLIYTDGITEAMNMKREQWGEQKFIDIIKKYAHLTPKEFIDNLDKEIKNFTGGFPQSDDITIVVIKEKSTDKVMFARIAREIKKLRKKRVPTEEIEKRLGIRMDNFKELVKEKKEEKGKEEIIFLTFEQKKELMKMVVDKPEESVSKYAEEMSKKYNAIITEEMVKSELRRANLVSAEHRKTYAQERKA